MRTAALLKSLMVVLLVVELAAAPLAATHSRHPGLRPVSAVQQDDDDAEGVTFDSLLRASSYTLYIEARNIGALLRSAEFRETFEPISPMLEQFGGAVEFKLVRLVTDNIDRLQHSRVMMAFNPTDSSLPSQLLAFELESEDAAKEFEIKIKESLGPLRSTGRKGSASQAGDVDVMENTNSLPGAIRRVEKLVVLSSTPLAFKALRKTGDKLMSEDMNFRAARDRFYAEPLFIYYDIGLAKHRTEGAENLVKQETENPRRASGAASSPTAEQNTDSADSVLPVSATPVAVAPPRSSPTTSAASGRTTPARSGSLQAPAAPRHEAAPTALNQADSQAPGRADQDLLGGLFTLLLSGDGQTPSPEAVAVALTLENDALAVRALLIGSPGAAVGPLPFVSLPVSGPALSSEAANYLPADTGIFVLASLDWPRLYDLATRQLRTPRPMPDGRIVQGAATDFAARRAVFETTSGVRMADLLGATLGNELALSIPASYLSGTPLGRVPLKALAAPAEPLMLIAVRDREALAPKLPQLLEAFGVKFANAKATTEKIGDIDINIYGNLAYAFINNYLMMAPSALSIRHALVARANNKTLAGSQDFQSYTAWQPRATLAQIYVSAAVLKGLFPDRLQGNDRFNDEVVKEFLARYRFDTEPVTYAASADGMGAHYELRIPKHLLMRYFSVVAASEIATRIPRNESMARYSLQSLKEQENAYKTEHGRYATLNELEDVKSVITLIERFGYKFELSTSDHGYEATATPVEYGKTGRLSFFTDQSGVVREGDHNGKPASSSDKPLDLKREY